MLGDISGIRLAGRKSFINRAQREYDPDEEPDLELKARVARVLRDHFGFSCEFLRVNIAIHSKQFFIKRTLTEKEYRSGWYWTHNPDIFARRGKTKLIVEIDGAVHWQNSKAVKNTNLRNEHYEKAKIPYIWITDKDADNYDVALIKLLEEKLLPHKIYSLETMEKATMVQLG